MKTLIFLFVLLINTSLLMSQNVQSLFESANENYNKGNFKEGIQLYDSIVKTGFESPFVYFNLGNSYYKLADFTSAVYYFEKAIKLEPNNDDFKYNLALTNEKIVDKIEAVPEFAVRQWWNFILFSFSESQWMWINIITYSLFLIALIVFFISKSTQIRQWYISIVAILFVVAITSGFIGFRSFQEKNTHNTAIVFTPTVNIKSAPDQKSKTIFILHQGSKISILESNTNWRKIKIADGSIGWIMIEDIKVI